MIDEGRRVGKIAEVFVIGHDLMKLTKQRGIGVVYLLLQGYPVDVGGQERQKTG